MHTRQIEQWHRRMERDRQHITSLMAAYKNPDPKLGGTPETLPWLAELMKDPAAGLLDTYVQLAKDETAPPSLRMAALAVRKVAADLCALLAEIALPAQAEVANFRTGDTDEAG